MPNKKTIRIAVIAVIVAAVIFAAINCITVIPTGFTGVKSTFGQISERILPQGINFKLPFIQDVILVNNKLRDTTLSGQVWGETKERTPVYASDITVTYSVNSDQSSWLVAHVSRNTEALMTESLVASAVKTAMVELKANEVTIRNRIEPLVKEKLIESVNEKYGENTLNIIKVVVNNMDFEESYNEAIAQKSIAQQTYERQQIENETAIAKAEAEKKVSVTNAEAKAEAMRIQAQAEADANKMISDSLTDEVLRNKFYDSWNGELPRVMGESSVITAVADVADSME